LDALVKKQVESIKKKEVKQMREQAKLTALEWEEILAFVL